MKKSSNILSFKSLRYSVNTVLLALIPVILAIIFLQVLVNTSLYDKQLRSLEVGNGYDIQWLIYYIVSGLVHIVICAVIASQFSLENKKNMVQPKLRLTRNTRLVFLFGVCTLVYILDSIHINMAYLSHDRLYVLLEKSDYFKSTLTYVPSKYQWFRLFSTFPFLLICMALAVMVYASFYIGNKMYRFIHDQEFTVDKIKEYVKDLHRMLRNYAQLLSIVMVSSTIATILFFQLPVPLIKDGIFRNDYSNVSMAMGICWGVVFSLTLLFLCVYPYRLAYKKISALIQMERVKNNPELEDWIDKHKSYYTFIWNLKLLASIVSPAAAGILTTILSHIL
jgi:hypothetical protein